MTFAGTGEHGHNESVRSRQALANFNKPENKPKTEQEKILDYYFARNQRELAEEKAKLAREAQARVDAEVARQKAAELKIKRQQFEFAENMRQDIYDRHGLTDGERSRLNQILLDRGAIHDMEQTEILAIDTVERRRA